VTDTPSPMVYPFIDEGWFASLGERGQCPLRLLHEVGQRRHGLVVEPEELPIMFPRPLGVSPLLLQRPHEMRWRGQRTVEGPGHPSQIAASWYRSKLTACSTSPASWSHWAAASRWTAMYGVNELQLCASEPKECACVELMQRSSRAASSRPARARSPASARSNAAIDASTCVAWR
jgi:hypothetical protein